MSTQMEHEYIPMHSNATVNHEWRVERLSELSWTNLFFLGKALYVQSEFLLWYYAFDSYTFLTGW